MLMNHLLESVEWFVDWSGPYFVHCTLYTEVATVGPQLTVGQSGPWTGPWTGMDNEEWTEEDQLIGIPIDWSGP